VILSKIRQNEYDAAWIIPKIAHDPSLYLAPLEALAAGPIPQHFFDN